MYIQRKIYTDLAEHLTNRQVTVITGMRQTGKTTIVKELLKNIRSENKTFIDLEKFDNRELFNEKNYDNIVNILEQRGLNFKDKVYIALDEIQLVPNVTSVIKYLYDEFKIKFILTGSSSFYIKNMFSESLAGRKKIFELYPLSFAEMLRFNNIPNKEINFINAHFNSIEYDRLKFYYDLYVEYGGFPEVVLADKISDKKDILKDIIYSYINVDIKSLSDIRNVKNFYALIKMLAARTGTRLDYSKISSLTGISRPSLYNYIYLLEQSFLISLVPVFTKNPDREIVKAKKIFFNDNGLISVLADAGSGSKFENAVFNQLRQSGEIKYYALKNGKEIDFIYLPYGEKKEIAFEAKETPTMPDLRYLENLSEQAGIKQHRLVGRKMSSNFVNYIWGGDVR